MVDETEAIHVADEWLTIAIRIDLSGPLVVNPVRSIPVLLVELRYAYTAYIIADSSLGHAAVR